mmetsp:Transcript_42753/g.112493  ORF Transcript_42753/g.112493 Transcript_42753/m.112493 type:complete len:209 (-) Transcript_42753:85-711(-)
MHSPRSLPVMQRVTRRTSSMYIVCIPTRTSSSARNSALSRACRACISSSTDIDAGARGNFSRRPPLRRSRLSAMRVSENVPSSSNLPLRAPSSRTKSADIVLVPSPPMHCSTPSRSISAVRIWKASTALACSGSVSARRDQSPVAPSKVNSGVCGTYSIASSFSIASRRSSRTNAGASPSAGSSCVRLWRRARRSAVVTGGGGVSADG